MSKIVVLGLMSDMPVPGVIWQTVHYLVGFEKLGCETYYVESHARTPRAFMASAHEDGSEAAAQFIHSVMRRFDLGDRWAYHARHSDGRYWGMSERAISELYASADLIINLHGGTLPTEEMTRTGRLAYVETDPVAPQIEIYDGVEETIEFLDLHAAHFTFAENYGNPDCLLPATDRYDFLPTRQPIVMDFWNARPVARDAAYTSIASWNQSGRQVVYRGEVYHWSKHLEFMKFLDLPRRTGRRFDLALNRHDDVRALLTDHDWKIRDALAFSTDIDAYRDYIQHSRGEFTVAKDQNVRLRSGWFSDRSAAYLAAGRPVVTQQTGFSRVLPTGRGLFAIETLEDAVQAVHAIERNYQDARRSARDIAREFFSYEVVLSALLGHFGLAPPVTVKGSQRWPGFVAPFPDAMPMGAMSDRTKGGSDTVEQLSSLVRFKGPHARSDIIVLVPPGETSFDGGRPKRWRALFERLAECGHRVFYVLPVTQHRREHLGRARQSGPRSFVIPVIGDDPAEWSSAVADVRHHYETSFAVIYADDAEHARWAVEPAGKWGWAVAVPARLASLARRLEQSSWVPVIPFRWSEAGNSPREREQTWLQRWREVDETVRRRVEPVSIIISTNGSAPFTSLCVEGVLAHTDYPNYEIIVADSVPTSGMQKYFEELVQSYPHVRIVHADQDSGHWSATSAGLRHGTGKLFILLKSGTIVPKGWTSRLLAHLNDPTVDLVVPSTNSAGNENEAPVSYTDFSGFTTFSRELWIENEGCRSDAKIVDLSCIAVRRSLLESVGVLDGPAGAGTDDHDAVCRRLLEAATRLVRAEDSFVHYFGHAVVPHRLGSAP